MILKETRNRQLHFLIRHSKTSVMRISIIRGDLIMNKRDR